MNTRQFLIEALKGLETAIPPSLNGHHAITFARYGSDEDGWQDKLALQVNENGVFHCFFLDESDLERTPAEFILAITTELAAPCDNEQIGVSGVKYI